MGTYFNLQVGVSHVADRVLLQEDILVHHPNYLKDEKEALVQIWSLQQLRVCWLRALDSLLSAQPFDIF